MTKTNRDGGPYDERYAELYNSIWWDHDHWKAEGEFHIKTISELIKPESKWLDVGCGNGHFLSNFPEVDRVGLDYSQAMIEEAKKRNPNVDFYHQSIIDDNEALENTYDFVSCTGQPWSYLTNFSELEKAATNLAKWTSDDGVCMLSQLDVSDLIGIDELPYFFDETDLPPGYAAVTGVYWIHKDISSTYHYCLSPNMDQWIRWLSVHFGKIEVRYGPHEPDYLTIPRRLLICSEKRKKGDLQPTKIIGEPVPAFVTRNANDVPYLSNKQLVKEMGRRIVNGSMLRAGVRRIFG